MLLQDFLENSRARLPRKIAVVSGGQRVSYAELDNRVNRIARGLISLGIRRGDRVLVFTRGRVDAIACLFGTLRAGAVFVMVPDTARAPYFRHLVTVTEAAAVFIDPELLPVLDESAECAGRSFRVILTRPDDSGG